VSLKVRVICGPTAGGKSALAMKLAESRDIAIISADSRQVYRDFDVGTAKPRREERARVTHYGIDVVDPGERYSAARWAENAADWIADALASGKTPVVVGGTGLYIRALFEPFAAVPDLHPTRRAELDDFLKSLSTEELREWCSQLDPSRAHLGRTQLLRSIETALLSGVQLSKAFGAASGSETRPMFTPAYLVVDPGARLHDRIEARVDGMLARGWVEEVKHLAELVPEDAPAWKSTGYRSIRDAIVAGGDLSTARERVIIDTRQYAKRQRTWFRHQLPAETTTRFDPEANGAGEHFQQWFEEFGD
jgi:tRNA dimethylallyltransferase